MIAGSSDCFIQPYETVGQAVAPFMRLFRGREDAYAQQQSDGRYRLIDKRVTQDVIRTHLTGEITIGLYVITPVEDTCLMTIVDVDSRSKSMAIALSDACRHTGLETDEFLLEASGNKGFHLWLFYDNPVPAWKALQAGKAIASSAGLLSQVEVFPKQEHVPQHGYGNLIKLPGRHAKSGRFSVFFSPDLTPLNFAVVETVQTLSEARMKSLSLCDERRPPPSYPYGVRQDVFDRALPCMERIFNGVEQGRRNICAFWLAIHLKKSGTPADLVRAILIDWNQRNRPPLQNSEVAAVVRRIFRNGYHGIGCNSSDMQAYCDPANCPFRAGMPRQ